MSTGPISEASSSHVETFAQTRARKTACIGGYEFIITEPGWRTASRAVELFMPLIGNRAELDAMIRDLTATFTDTTADEDTKQARAVEIIFKDEHEIAALDADGIAELLALVTDKDADWFTDDRLGYDDMMALLQEVATVLPFGRVFAQRGLASMAFVTSWTTSLAENIPSSPGNSGDSAGPTSAPVDLDGLRASSDTPSPDGEPN